MDGGSQRRWPGRRAGDRKGRRCSSKRKAAPVDR